MKKTTTYSHYLLPINRGSLDQDRFRFILFALLLSPLWVVAQNIVYPPATGVTNLVSAYGLVPNNVAEATNNSTKLQQAIVDCYGRRYDPASTPVSQVLYFPNGTYYINKKLTLGAIQGTGTTSREVIFQGQSRDGAILRLVDASPDFDGVSSTAVTPMLVFFEGTFNNNAMGNYVRNLTIDIGADNPNAIGLDFHNNNYGGILDVTIKTRDSQKRGKIGLKMNIENTGIGYVKNVRVEGFDQGINVGAYAISYLFEDIELEGQRVAGLVNLDKPIQIRRLTSRNAVPAIVNTPTLIPGVPGVGTIVIIDSKLFYTGDRSLPTPAINNQEGGVFARNLTIDYPVRFLDLGVNRSAELPDGGELSSRGVYNIDGLTIGTSMNLPIKDAPVIPWDEDFNNWAIVDPNANGTADDADAINAAIASGKSTIWVRYGFIYVNKPIVFPDGHQVKRFLVQGEINVTGSTLTTNDGVFDPAIKKAVFEIGTGANEALLIQGIRTQNGNYYQYVQNNSKKTLILRHDSFNGANRVYRNRYDASHTPGTLFIEDVNSLASNPYGVTMPGPGFLFDHQEVFARNLNPENVNPMVHNKGGKLWMMGFDTEGYGVPFVTTDYGSTEVLGAIVFGVFRGDVHQEIINTTDANVSVIVSERGRFPELVRPIVVVDTRYGVTKTMAKGVMPQTMKEGKFALSTDVPLFIVSVVNTAPVTTANPSQTATTGSGFAYTVNPFDDAETPTSLTYTATGLPAELTFNANSRVISGVPSTTVGSPYSVTITATDPGGLSGSTTFTLSVIAAVTVAPLSVIASANPTTILTTGTTTLLGTVSGGTSPYSYTFTGPGTITQTGNSATVSGLAAGTQTFTVTVRDATTPTSQTASATVMVTVNLPPNTAPQSTTNINRTATVGIPFLHTVTAFTDAETPTGLTYAATGLPAELSFDPATRIISGTPTNTSGSPFTVTITATDPPGLSASTTFSIRVLDPSQVSSLTGVVISQIYGGGASGGTTPQNDYVELFNQSNVSVPLDGWTVQASSSGTSNFSNNVVDLTGIIAPGQYYLVRLAGGTTGRALPTPDASNPALGMGSGAGKVAVVNSTLLLACSSSSPNTPCPAASVARIVDLVGYGTANFFEGSGPAPTPSNTVASFRKLSGCTDTNNNTADFATATPAPRNSASPTNVCNPVAVASLTLVASASPTTILTTGTTTLSANVSGGTPPYGYSFAGPGTLTLGGNTASVSGLTAGTQTFTLTVADATTPTSQTISGTVSVTVTASVPVNTAPTMANVIPPQSATVGQMFSYVIPASTFTDAETPDQLTLSVSGLPNGLSFTAPATISGTPSLSLTPTVMVTATDPGSLSASTSFALTVSPALMTVTPGGPFSITGVTTGSCTTISAGERNLTFTPQYAGATGQPITFQVVNELPSTTAPGPYTLRLYTDNPTITLKATQTGSTGEVSFAYNWLAACGTPAPGPGSFAIASVSTTVCEVLSAGERRLTFTPVYSGASGSPISFSVVNELLPTTAPGPYVLRLYTDNPTITLSARQSGAVATFGYNWLVACGSGSPRLGVAEVAEPLRVTILGNPLRAESVRVRVAGTGGQPLRLLVTEVGGKVVAERFSSRPASSEEYELDFGGRPAGPLLLRASTPTQAQTVKLIKP
ncbi:putative Ig domain-containing protein [Spirosoma arcticum]